VAGWGTGFLEHTQPHGHTRTQAQHTERRQTHGDGHTHAHTHAHSHAHAHTDTAWLAGAPVFPNTHTPTYTHTDMAARPAGVPRAHTGIHNMSCLYVLIH